MAPVSASRNQRLPGAIPPKRIWPKLLLLAIAGAIAYYGFIETPPGSPSLRSFDPDRMASLEVDMWKAYDAKQNVQLFELLATQVHEQNRTTWAQAVRQAYYLAHAAATFADLQGHYEQVLPDLEAAYTMVRDRNHATFDPAKVAQAELNWWVSRRQQGHDTPEIIGGLIAEEYAMLYDSTIEQMIYPATLRAQAGRVRDDGGDNPDWATVSDLLHQSYRALHTALQ